MLEHSLVCECQRAEDQDFVEGDRSQGCDHFAGAQNHRRCCETKQREGKA